ncbi:MAG TPA: BrnA antitoxin family protein [Anaerolineae bacterium]|nr:BrnA antitoxin family protein [Anaerolineae bacterium]
MKDRYDFSQGKRGAIELMPRGKTRITIRIDDDILDWFRAEVNAAGGGNYQTLINHALREYVQSRKQSLEEVLGRVVREELSASRGGSKRIAPQRAGR